MRGNTLLRHACTAGAEPLAKIYAAMCGLTACLGESKQSHTETPVELSSAFQTVRPGPCWTTCVQGVLEVREVTRKQWRLLGHRS